MANILILEDDYALAKSWRGSLHKAGHVVEICYTSSEALALLEAWPVELCIVDLLLKTGENVSADSGLNFLRELPKSELSGKLKFPVIGVSAYQLEGWAAGANDLFANYNVSEFLAKPFEPNELVELVAKVLKSV